MIARGPERARYLRSLREQRAKRKVAVVSTLASLERLRSSLLKRHDDHAVDEALKERLRRQVKRNELFNRVIDWRRINKTATVGEMTQFVALARRELELLPQDCERIELAVETVYRAEQQAERKMPPGQPLTFWQKLGAIFLDTH
jgi:hypothetical protein